MMDTPQKKRLRLFSIKGVGILTAKKLSTFFFDSEQVLKLRAQVQPYSPKEDLWSWYVLRRISIYVTLLFQKIKVSPNSVSWLSVIFVLLSGLFMVIATPTSFIFAFLAYNLGYLFDCVDGELARLTKKTSKQGYFIDMLIRAATLPVFLSFLISYLVITDKLLLPSVSLIILYIVIVAVIMSLLIPLSYDLTYASLDDNQDPVQKIRNRSIVFELAGFLLGLPGFFFTIILVLLVETLINIPLIPIYIMLFMIVLVIKVFLRLIVTIRTFNS